MLELSTRPALVAYNIDTSHRIFKLPLGLVLFVSCVIMAFQISLHSLPLSNSLLFPDMVGALIIP
ncbi:uncharacterized protein K444DRAFT_724042 [Hyaloscypha bicolor E]|uniref:Uncharacterized protein n=1 Tax=Hyaloscypha bicolor E TaxID=1095630 RepID=A0A2J6T6D5_9HELO|nr:uncharacterized protein K444DRAFT_724042 [Hyaloscypha bicolor E]PMD58591.1 hypothetical protein K444DRAFT_724042 [Hyaloscypha bicolor E]